MTTPSHEIDAELAARREEVAAIETAMRAAAWEAVLLHKRLGLPLVEWHDGRIVLVPADQVSDEPPSSR